MSKRVDTSGLDAGYIIGQAVKSNREAKSAPTPAPPPTTVVATVETFKPEAAMIVVQPAAAETESGPVPIPVIATPPSAEPVREAEPSREESRRRKSKEQEYQALFFKGAAIKTRTGKVVYIRKEFHDRILKIVRVIGENEFSLFNYLDNILELHFNTWQDTITELYHKKHTDVF